MNRIHVGDGCFLSQPRVN